MTTSPSVRTPRAVQPLVALRLALKGLRRSPGTTALAVAILSMGLAFPATFFSFLLGAIRPLPVPEGDRVVRVDVVDPERAGSPVTVTGDELAALGELPSLEALGGFRTLGGTLVEPGRVAARVPLAELTPEVLPLLRVAPAMGRVPNAGEPALLIAHRVWQETFGADPDVLGRSVDVGGMTRAIVGVMPDGFAFPFNQGAWIVSDARTLASTALEIVGRLADGAEIESAQAEASVRWTQTDALRPAAARGRVVVVDDFTSGRGEGGEAVAFIGLVLVALSLLLIACANVANLLLVRASERVRALGIQSALGAGRIQVGLQLLLEALVIAAAGGVAGLGTAWILVGTIENGLGAMHWGYHWMHMAIDLRVLAFTTVLVIGTALVAGMLPVVRVSRVDLQRVLKQESGSGGVGAEAFWARSFVTGQLALSCAALVAAGLAARSLGSSTDIGDGLPTNEILIATASVEGDAGLPEAFVSELVPRAGAEPGVRAVAMAIGAPGFREPWSAFELDGVLYDRAKDRPRSAWNGVGEAYFDVLGLELRAGRGFRPSDAADAEPVAIVNEAFAASFSPERSVVGRSVRLGGAAEPWRIVVGVVEDATVGGGSRVRHDRVYVPASQAGNAATMVLVRTSGDAGGVVPALRRVVSGIDGSVVLDLPMTLAEGHAFMTRVPRAMSAFAVGGGLAGLFVAAVGLYGLLAYRIRLRRRELGVRLAIGADGARLARETMEVALRQLVPAVLVGLALAWLASPILSVLLLGTDPRGASTYVAVAGAFLTVGLLASALPALRASATDPARVLRGE